MESILPFIDPQEVEVEEIEVPYAREYAWDINELEFKFKDGKMYLVEGIEAVKIWIWKLFMTTRYREMIFDLKKINLLVLNVSFVVN